MGQNNHGTARTDYELRGREGGGVSRATESCTWPPASRPGQGQDCSVLGSPGLNVFDGFGRAAGRLSQTALASLRNRKLDATQQSEVWSLVLHVS